MLKTAELFPVVGLIGFDPTDVAIPPTIRKRVAVGVPLVGVQPVGDGGVTEADTVTLKNPGTPPG